MQNFKKNSFDGKIKILMKMQPRRETVEKVIFFSTVIRFKLGSVLSYGGFCPLLSPMCPNKIASLN